MEIFEVVLNTFCIVWWLQVYGDQGVVCSGLNGNGPHRLVCSNAWPIKSGVVIRCGLVGGTTLLCGQALRSYMFKLGLVMQSPAAAIETLTNILWKGKSPLSRSVATDRFPRPEWITPSSMHIKAALIGVSEVLNNNSIVRLIRKYKRRRWSCEVDVMWKVLMEVEGSEP